MLSEVEDYYEQANLSVVLDIIPDKWAKMLRVETAWEKEEQAKCPDSCTSADNIPSGHQMLNKLAQLPNFKPFKSGHEKSIVQLCVTLQHAHNTAAEVTGYLAFLGHTLHLDQFSFILKHSVHPLIQISVPAGLSDPTHIQFEHPALSEEECFEEKAINSVLPMPHHLDLEKVPLKDPSHCLAAAVHYVLRFRLFKNNPSQRTTVDKFQVEWKKFYQAITGKMYDAGKKTPRALKMKKDKAVTEKPTKTTEQATPKEQEKQEVAPLNAPPDEDDILYCDTDDDSDTSLPDPFAPIDPKKAKTLNTKEDQAEDTATQTPEVMDTTDIPELISDQPRSSPSRNQQARDHIRNNLFSKFSYLQTSKFIILFSEHQNSKVLKKYMMLFWTEADLSI